MVPIRPNGKISSFFFSIILGLTILSKSPVVQNDRFWREFKCFLPNTGRYYKVTHCDKDTTTSWLLPQGRRHHRAFTTLSSKNRDKAGSPVVTGYTENRVRRVRFPRRKPIVGLNIFRRFLNAVREGQTCEPHRISTVVTIKLRAFNRTFSDFFFSFSRY